MREVQVQHGEFVCKDGVAQITTLAQKWANATGVLLGDLGPLATSALWLEVEIEVVSGRVGVGVLAQGGDYQGAEQFLDAGPIRTLLIPLTDPVAVTMLMVRNGHETGDASVARVSRVSVGRL